MSLSASPSPPLSELLSAPSLDPYVAYLDDALLSRLYGQPPPLPLPSATASSPSSSSSVSASSTPSASSPQSALAAVDAALLSCLSAAWRCCLQLDAGPSPLLPHTAARSAAPLGAQDGSDATDVSGAVSSFLSSLAELDASVRGSAAASSLPLVPHSLLSMMDEGRNPELILSSALQTASDVNDAVRGRIIATEALRALLRQYREAAGNAAQ